MYLPCLSRRWAGGSLTGLMSYTTHYLTTPAPHLPCRLPALSLLSGNVNTHVDIHWCCKICLVWLTDIHTHCASLILSAIMAIVVKLRQSASGIQVLACYCCLLQGQVWRSNVWLKVLLPCLPLQVMAFSHWRFAHQGSVDVYFWLEVRHYDIHLYDYKWSLHMER